MMGTNLKAPFRLDLFYITCSSCNLTAQCEIEVNQHIFANLIDAIITILGPFRKWHH